MVILRGGLEEPIMNPHAKRVVLWYGIVSVATRTS
jgi:hypothetical protein